MDYTEHIDSIKTLIPSREDYPHELERRRNVKPQLDTSEEREINYMITDFDAERTGSMINTVRAIAKKANVKLSNKNISEVVRYAGHLGMVKSDLNFPENITRITAIMKGMAKEEEVNPRGVDRPKDGRGKGEGRPGGLGKARNKKFCNDGPGKGEGEGKGKGLGREGSKKTSSLAEALHNAELVQHDEDHGLMYVWFGGDMISVFTDNGEEIDVWTMGGIDPNKKATREDVLDSIENHKVYIDEQNSYEDDEVEASVKTGSDFKEGRDFSAPDMVELVRDPSLAKDGGPTAEFAEKFLREELAYNDEDMSKLKGASKKTAALSRYTRDHLGGNKIGKELLKLIDAGQLDQGSFETAMNVVEEMFLPNQGRILDGVLRAVGLEPQAYENVSVQEAEKAIFDKLTETTASKKTAAADVDMVYNILVSSGCSAIERKRNDILISGREGNGNIVIDCDRETIEVIDADVPHKYWPN